MGPPSVNSLKLAALAFVLVVPLGIIGGVVAALNVGKPADRVHQRRRACRRRSIPEVVSGIFLILIFGIWLNVLPIQASTPPGSGLGTQLYHLLLPAIPLVLVLFGYIQQMARAGTVEALDSDYARTAMLKGLPRGRHDPPPRAAQLAAADDHRHRHPDRAT